jgi:exodeoxyribonuclease VII large subunit
VNPQTISVTEFVSIINETLAFAYPQVLIEGEVSSFKVNQGKFVFFDLKDEANVLNCFMMVHQLKMPIEDGMKVRVLGSPKVTKFSKFSLTVRDVELAGEGALRRAMELLKKKLEGEGLFDPARKRPIPAFPTRLGLITSGASAAYADFIKILSARWGGIEVLLADVSVQGAQAPDQIVGALEYFNTLRDPVDVLVLIRGGGSLEDLAAFSTEPVARAVAASRTPIIVGVGHEVDFSLADYAADLRAATPTDAARLVVPDRHETEATIEHLARRISHAQAVAIHNRRAHIDAHLGRLEAYLRHPRERVSALEAALWRSLDRLAHAVRSRAQAVTVYEHRLAGFERLVLSERKSRITGLERLLHGYDPQAVLGRGYAIARAGSRILRDPADVAPGTAIDVQLAKGRLDAQVAPKSAPPKTP